MADEQVEKSPNSAIKLAMIGVAAIIVIAAAVGGTLMATGAFNDDPAISAEDALSQLEGGNNAVADLIDTNAEPLYHEFERPLLTNVANSRKIVQAKIAIMTRNTDTVLPNVQKHDFALRSEMLDVMRKVTEADIDSPDFRDKLADKLKDAINGTLKRMTGHGGVEEVLFTELVVQ